MNFTRKKLNGLDTKSTNKGYDRYKTNQKQSQTSTYRKWKKRNQIILGRNTILIKEILTYNTHIENLSAKTDILRNLLKKQNEWFWTDEHTEAFNKLKEGITKIPCLEHYNAQNENITITYASTKGFGATLWQKQKDGNSKPVGFASRYLSETEKKYAINEL